MPTSSTNAPLWQQPRQLPKTHQWPRHHQRAGAAVNRFWEGGQGTGDSRRRCISSPWCFLFLFYFIYSSTNYNYSYLLVREPWWPHHQRQHPGWTATNGITVTLQEQWWPRHHHQRAGGIRMGGPWHVFFLFLDLSSILLGCGVGGKGWTQKRGLRGNKLQNWAGTLGDRIFLSSTRSHDCVNRTPQFCDDNCSYMGRVLLWTGWFVREKNHRIIRCSWNPLKFRTNNHIVQMMMIITESYRQRQNII